MPVPYKILISVLALLVTAGVFYFDTQAGAGFRDCCPREARHAPGRRLPVLQDVLGGDPRGPESDVGDGVHDKRGGNPVVKLLRMIAE